MYYQIPLSVENLCKDLYNSELFASILDDIFCSRIRTWWASF